jgi:hypothetical protein
MLVIKYSGSRGDLSSLADVTDFRALCGGGTEQGVSNEPLHVEIAKIIQAV